MARGKKKESALTLEEKLAQALVPDWEWPYQVPENWCWTKIGAVSDFERGITFPASAKESEASEDNIPCLRTANVQENLEIDDLIYVNRGFMKSNEAKLVRENDIIMSSANSRELVGKSSFVTHVPFPMTFGGFVLNIRACGISSKYLFYFLRHEFLAGKFMGESTQTTNIANINTTTLGDYELPLPPLAEQQRIVDRIEYLFAKLDEAKEKAQSVLDSFETRKAAILHKAFTGELTAKWRVERGAGMGTWKDTKFRDFCLLKRGFDLPASQRVKGDFPLVSSSGIIDSHNVAQVKGPGVVTGRSGTIGKVFYIEGDYWPLNTTLYSEKLFDNDAQYVCYYLQTFDFKSFSSSTAVPTLNRNQFLDEIVCVPPTNEQKEIVRTLDSLFAKEQRAKEAAETVLDQIELLKKSILARAFRGELGTNDPNEESAVELLKAVL